MPFTSLFVHAWQGFLTAVKQEVTRRHAADNWALDDVLLVSEVTRFVDAGAVRDAPPEGVYIHGLHLEGCGWSGKEGRLVPAEPKKLLCPLPVSPDLPTTTTLMRLLLRCLYMP